MRSTKLARSSLNSALGRRADSSLQLAVIVAMVSVGMVQMAIHQVVDMTSVGYDLMSTVRTVNVRLIVPGTVVFRGAFLRIHRVHSDAVVVHVIAMGMV